MVTRPYWSAVAFVDDEPVLVRRRGEVEGDEALRLERGVEGRGRGGRVGRRLAGAAVHELERGRRVLGEHVDLAGLERGEHDLAVAELELALDRRPVPFEGLGEDLAEDLLLVEVGRADGDVALDPGTDRIEVLGRDPLASDVRHGLEVDRHGLVEVRQLFLGQARDDGVENGRHAGVRIHDLLADDRHDVVGELELLVVLEQDEARWSRSPDPT